MSRSRLPEGVAKNISSRPPHAFHLFHNFYYADVIQSLQILRGIWTPETITCAIIEQISQWLSYVGQAMTNSSENSHFEFKVANFFLSKPVG